MQHKPEISIVLPQVTVQLATVEWSGIEETPAYDFYSLSQRLSPDHAPLRIGNLSASSVLPRLHSVGLLPPGQPIRLLPVEKPLRVLLCLYNARFFEESTQVSRTLWESHTEALVAMRNKRLEIMMQEIFAELEQPGFGSELLVESVTNIMMIELARILRLLDRKRQAGKAPLALAPWQLNRIQARVEAAPEQGYPNTAQLAELCGLSEGHLARSFKAATGWQLHKFVADERIKAAKRLLAEEGMTCEAVSGRLGFKSPSYFSTAFRRATGKSPREYRNQLLSKP